MPRIWTVFQKSKKLDDADNLSCVLSLAQYTTKNKWTLVRPVMYTLTSPRPAEGSRSISTFGKDADGGTTRSKIVNRPSSHQTQWDMDVCELIISYFGSQVQSSQNDSNVRDIRGYLIAPS